MSEDVPLLGLVKVESTSTIGNINDTSVLDSFGHKK
jgi:hypothetical protein